MEAPQAMNEHAATILLKLQTQFDVWLENQLFNNEFLIAGIATVLIGFAGYLVRNVPGRLWAFLLRVFTIELTVNNDVETFVFVMRYINRNRIPWLQRTYILGTENYNVRDASWLIGPGYGMSAFVFDRRLVIANLSKEESDSQRFKMALNLRFIGRSSARMSKFIDLVKREAECTDRSTIDIYTLGAGGHWHCVVSDKPYRDLNTVFMPAAKKAEICDRMDTFYSSEDWYRQRGLAWKTGILLSGPPGTGKSSLIHAVASRYDKNVKFLNLNVLTDMSMGNMIAMLNSRDILVIEDIDTFPMTGERRVVKIPRDQGAPTPTPEDSNKDEQLHRMVSLSSLLNMLDGFLSPDGIVTIATTNHPENLDQALLRKGRFDGHIRLGPLDDECLADMFAAFYGEDHRWMIENSSGLREMTGAEAQDLFRHRSPEEAVAEITKAQLEAAV